MGVSKYTPNAAVQWFGKQQVIDRNCVCVKTVTTAHEYG